MSEFDKQVQKLKQAAFELGALQMKSEIVDFLNSVNGEEQLTKYIKQTAKIIDQFPLPVFKDEIKKACPECEGTGKALETCCGDPVTGEVEDYRVCPTCGEHIDTECENCNGTGFEIERTPPVKNYLSSPDVGL